VVAVLSVCAVAILCLPALVVLIESVAAETSPVSGVVAATLLLLGLPAFAMGMYGLVSGEARAMEGHGLSLLSRPPVSYLVLGIVLLLGAAIAAG
jgi:hypothetical protein